MVNCRLFSEIIFYIIFCRQFLSKDLLTFVVLLPTASEALSRPMNLGRFILLSLVIYFLLNKDLIWTFQSFLKHHWSLLISLSLDSANVLSYIIITFSNHWQKACTTILPTYPWVAFFLVECYYVCRPLIWWD